MLTAGGRGKEVADSRVGYNGVDNTEKIITTALLYTFILYF